MSDKPKSAGKAVAVELTEGEKDDGRYSVQTALDKNGKKSAFKVRRIQPHESKYAAND